MIHQLSFPINIRFLRVHQDFFFPLSITITPTEIELKIECLQMQATAEAVESEFHPGLIPAWFSTCLRLHTNMHMHAGSLCLLYVPRPWSKSLSTAAG